MPTITFQRVKAEEWLDAPAPAAKHLPAWYKEMPQRCDTEPGTFPMGTAKSCSPFQDALCAGYIITLPWALDVDCNADGALNISWRAYQTGSGFTPVGYHSPDQLPCDEIKGQVFKFNFPWGVSLPEGYSALWTHPLNRPDLPFQTFSGIIDRFTSPASMAFLWVAGEGRTILDAGLPVAQIIPFKREEWDSRCDTVEGAEMTRDSLKANSSVFGYRRHFKMPKVWR